MATYKDNPIDGDRGKIGHNWLAAVAADIRALHAGIRRNAEQAARDTIEAGKLLIEAKAGLEHGEWEDWLRQNCDLSARTARRYMAVARSGLEPAIVADLGLTAAAQAIVRDQRYQLRLVNIRSHARRVWQNLLEAGRHFGAVRAEIGEEQFRAWVPLKTGFVADEALFLAEIARLTDSGGDVAALLARDDVPKELHLPAGLMPSPLSAGERPYLTDPGRSR
jgi:hypothetical protein